MAIQITNGGTFNKGTGARPGLYVRFIEAAVAAIEVGSYAKVATVIAEWDVTAAAQNGKVYQVTTVAQAKELFGNDYVDNIERMFNGGAEEVVVATTNTAPVSGTPYDYTSTLANLETYEFHIFAATNDAPGINEYAFTFMKNMLAIGKLVILVLGYSVDVEGSHTAVITEATNFAHEQTVFVANGVVKANGEEVAAPDYAAYVAGIIAGNGITGSLTYENVPYAATITRYNNAAVKAMLAAGLLVTVMDGNNVRIEQGLTMGSGANELKKIRTLRAKQAIVMDIDAAVKENYIGQITNNEDGQIAIVNAIKAYLEILAGEGVIAAEPTVIVDPAFQSVGSDLYVQIGVRFLDAIEYVLITVSYS